MNRRSTSTTPKPILQLQRQLEDFRSSQPGRVKLPDALWQAAVELARQYGLWPVAHPLRLDYMRLKKRLGEVPPPHRRKTAPPSFIELVAQFCREKLAADPFSGCLLIFSVESRAEWYWYAPRCAGARAYRKSRDLPGARCVDRR